jgi:haloacetate dehalogenase
MPHSVALVKCYCIVSLWSIVTMLFGAGGVSQARCVEGLALDATHYMAEEIPDEITVRMADFFSRHMTDQDAI